MLDPRTGEVLALASTPVYDAGRRARATPANEDSGLRRPSANNKSTAAPAPSDARRRYVPGARWFKDRDRVRWPRAPGRICARHDVREPGQGREGRARRNGFRVREHAGVPARTLDLVGATEVSSNIWFAWPASGRAATSSPSSRRTMGFGSSLPFDLPTRAVARSERRRRRPRRLRRRHGARERLYARPRRSSRRSRWRSSLRPSRTTAS
jgi:cell division protein FtsI/penicillin-binding protein 2